MEIILFSIGLVIFTLNLLRELFVLRDIKSKFYCEHCGTFIPEITNTTTCSSCKRKIKIKGDSWDHLIIHRVSWMPTKVNNEVLKWNEYKKLSIIEITINLVAIIFLIIAILINVYSGAI